MALTLQQRRALAMQVLDRVGTLFEFWDEQGAGVPYLEDVDPNEAAQVVANWLAPLPTGDRWNIHLPQPTVK